MATILLVGAGQLGSRYLQGLAGIEAPLAIWVVDPSEPSLSVAKERFIQVPMASAHEVRFCTSLDEIPLQIDLALVVTPAHCRARVVEELASRHQVKAWILEKVLAQSCMQLDQIEKALSGHSQVWVNTPMRLMSWHQSIRAQLLPNGPVHIQITVSGGSWGLACNAVHYIDLVSWWTRALVASINPESLGYWVPSKRSGFQEVLGNLRVSYDDGTELELCCHEGTEPIQISVVTPEGKWLIEESAGRVTGPDGQQLFGQLCFQSAITAPLVKQILQNGQCHLPTLAESLSQHRPLLSAFQMHWNKFHSYQDSIVPIT